MSQWKLVDPILEEQKMSHNVHKFWLIISSVVIWSFGPVFALGSVESTSELARLSLDILSWPVDGAQSFADPTTRFLSALTGGFLFGWGIMVLCLRQWVYPMCKTFSKLMQTSHQDQGVCGRP